MTNFKDDDLDSMNGDTSDEPQSLSLMGGIANNSQGFDAADLDITAMDSGGGLMSKGTLLILLIALIGAGSLYAMRATQSDMSDDAAMKKMQAEMENKLIGLKTSGDFDKEFKESMSVTDEILETLANNATEKQVPVEFTKKNPFVLPVKKVEIKISDAGPKVDESEVAKARAHEQMMGKLNKELEGLALKSVIPNGARSVAVIGNKVVQVGNTVGSFKVTKIENVTVHLSASGENFMLTLKSNN